jgi:hypothetical protein
MLSEPIQNSVSTSSDSAQPAFSERAGAPLDPSVMLMIPEANVVPDLQCPLCRGRVSRIPRRPIDKLMSRVRYMQRYRCASYMCGWEGNIRVAKPRQQ